MGEFIWPVRVYYEDTDSGGVVYHANYLKFMERARSEWLRSLGFEQDALKNESGIIFAVRAISVDFRRPARFNQLLEVSARIGACGKASLSFEQHIRHNNELLCSGRVNIACLDAATLKAHPIPKHLLAQLSS
ncbi:MAG: tol-pal system-associated acyl-CoA thioesterase [Gammaproteobacteria bacterium]|nr:MAG: tol-pal system-associated acyl-CoA thioesterase [Gammaproteobacteria bacterium]